WGRRFFQILGARKTVEGSLAMLGVSWVVAAGVLFFWPGLGFKALLPALGIAIGATGLEALGHKGLDNLLIPLGGALLTGLLT
ncbi:MAG: phosphatidate cytidylyltransferase, partial [Candidatus Omnitrophica bacterium]|nr:phosphatidate cytidylyltransferase [Candidatus Omnitrophota bacterium]